MSERRQCNAEIEDRVAMRDLPSGHRAWKGCPRTAVGVYRSRYGTFLCYCAEHAKMKGHGAECKPVGV